MQVDNSTLSLDCSWEKSMFSPTGWKNENLPPLLHASSPTVVNGYEWEYQSEAPPNKWHQLINGVFRELPFTANKNFLEEFHYTVVSSDLINASNSWRLSKMPTDQMAPTIVQGRSKTIGVRNYRYIATVLRIRKTVNHLKFNSGIRRRIVVALLIALHLTCQRELRKLKYLRRNTLSMLKSMLDSLQQLRMLQRSYFAAHKEISNHNDNDNDRTGLVVKDLLGSSLDLLFYSMMNVTQDLLSITNSQELSKYCEIYDVPLPELYYRLREPANDMESRWNRLKVMRSFMLCCLLSQNHGIGTNSSCDLEMCNFLRKVFPNYNELAQNSLINQSSRLKLLTTNMQHLQTLTTSISASMLRHTEVISNYRDSALNSKCIKRYSKFYLPSEDKQGPKRSSATLNGLRELERLLIVTNENTTTNDSTNTLVRQKLADLLSLWKIDNNNNDEHIERGRKSHVSRTKFGNRGLSLDVIQNPRESLVKCGGPHLDSLPKLDDQVQFTAVEDTQSDIEQESDCELQQRIGATEPSSDEEAFETQKQLRSSDKTLIDHRIAKFKSLSDEELRLKLDEGISKFAQENRKGRHELRSQKSFKLLRTPYTNEFMTVQGAVRQISSASEITLKNTFSAEETIPMYYELQKILDR